MRQTAIGVDIGGTSVRLGVLGGGRIFFREAFSTKAVKGREALLGELTGRIRGLLALAKKRGWDVRGIGVGAPGPVDVERGFVYLFPNIPGWRNTPLKRRLERRLKMPVFVDNDANAMALAEFLFGAGRGAENVIALTLGTGVGGGLVIHGRLFHGPFYSAAEIGHTVINEEGPLCSCGQRGCVETYVGSGYFVREIKRRLARGEKSLLSRWAGEGKELSPLLAAQAAKKGDRFAAKLWEETASHLATALAGLVNILNPEVIILGGGIAQNGEVLFRPLRTALRKKAFPAAARSVRVVPAALGADAGLIGAAALVFSRIDGSLTLAGPVGGHLANMPIKDSAYWQGLRPPPPAGVRRL